MQDLLNWAQTYAIHYWRYRAMHPGSSTPADTNETTEIAHTLADFTKQNARNSKFEELLLNFANGSLTSVLPTNSSLTNPQISRARAWLREQSTAKKLHEVSTTLQTLNKKDPANLVGNILLSGLIQGAQRNLQVSATRSSPKNPPKAQALLGCAAFAILQIHPERSSIINQLASFHESSSCDDKTLYDLYQELMQLWHSLGNKTWKPSRKNSTTELQALEKYEKTQDATSEKVYAELLNERLELVMQELKAADVRFMALHISKLRAASADSLMLKAAASHTSQAAVEMADKWYRAGLNTIGLGFD